MSPRKGMPGRKRLIASLVLGLLFGCALLLVVFWNTDLSEVGHALARVNYAWIALGFALYLIATLFRSARMRAVIAPSHGGRIRPYVSGILIAELVDLIIPVGVGFFLRPYLVSKGTSVPAGRAFAGSLLDRLLEVYTMLALVLCVVLFIPFDAITTIPAGMASNTEPIEISRWAILLVIATIFAVITGIGGVLLVLYHWGEQATRLWAQSLQSLAGRRFVRLEGMAVSLARDLRMLRSWEQFGRAMLYGCLFWFFATLALLCYFAAVGVYAPPQTPLLAAALLLFAQLGPNAPGWVGQYHLAMVLALAITVPGISETDAKAAAIVSHLSYSAGLALFGLLSLALEVPTWRFDERQRFNTWWASLEDVANDALAPNAAVCQATDSREERHES